MFLVRWNSPMLWLFYITCMGARFFAVELHNAIRFSTLSRMSGFLWHSFKWLRRFGRFLQNTSGLEMLACSLANWGGAGGALRRGTAPFHEPLSKVAATFKGKTNLLSWEKTSVDETTRVQQFTKHS